jgi:general stress protein 26
LIFPEHEDKEMESLDVFNRCLGILRTSDVCALATALEAKPRARAMEYAVDDAGIIYMLTEGGRKVRDILLNPNVSVAAWATGEASDMMNGLTITARAEIVDPGDRKRFTDYYENYRRFIGRNTPSVESLPKTVKLIRVIPDVIELFDPSLRKEGFSSKQVWRR